MWSRKQRLSQKAELKGIMLGGRLRPGLIMGAWMKAEVSRKMLVKQRTELTKREAELP